MQILSSFKLITSGSWAFKMENKGQIYVAKKMKLICDSPHATACFLNYAIHTPGSCYNSFNLHCTTLSMLHIMLCLDMNDLNWLENSLNSWHSSHFPSWIAAGRWLSHMRLNPDWHNVKREQWSYNRACVVQSTQHQGEDERRIRLLWAAP